MPDTNNLQLSMKVKLEQDFALTRQEIDMLMVMMPERDNYLVTIPLEKGTAVGFMSPKLYEIYRECEGSGRMEIADCIKNTIKYRSKSMGVRTYRSDNLRFDYYLDMTELQQELPKPDPVIFQKLASDDYAFLKTDPHLGNSIVLLCIAGSRAYGLNTEDSDIDIRGCALNTKEEILTGSCFEQVESHATDTVIYSFNKIVSLLSRSNPNVLELLGLRPEDYLYISPVGQELLENRNLFISKQVVKTFGGYARAQLKRIRNGASGYATEAEALEAERMQIESGILDLHKQYDSIQCGKWNDLKLMREDDGNILVASSFNQVPIQDASDLANELKRILREAKTKGKRNEYAGNLGCLCKHMMHLIRLLITCTDLLETGEITTYMEKKKELLCDVRDGKYLDENGRPSQEFYGIAEELEAEMRKAEENSGLPENPDYRGIRKFRMEVNERIVLGNI